MTRTDRAATSPAGMSSAGMSGTAALVRTGGVLAALAATGLMVGACGSSDSAGEETPTSKTDAAAYKDGTYTQTGEYDTPGGTQSVGVTVTLANSVITAVSIDTSKTRGPSAEFQGKFKSGIDALVVGKNINEIDVNKVSGSSLTHNGFDAAIEKIKQQAQV